ALVGAEGGPKEAIADGASGTVLASNDPVDWAVAIDQILADEAGRLRMSLAAIARAARLDLPSSFEKFWADHLSAVEPELPDGDLINSTAQARLKIPPIVSKDPAGL